MRTKIFNALKVSALAVLMTVGISYVYAAFPLPTAIPPGGNLPGPIDVSAVSQTKAGGLTTGTLQTSTLGVGAAPSTVSGIYAVSGGTPNIGIYGGNVNTYGYGVYGYANTGVHGYGTGSYGVYGETANAYAAGVAGSGQLVGVSGMSSQPSGTGVFATGDYGVLGYGNVADFYAKNKGIKFSDGSMQTTAVSWKQCEGSNGTTFNESFTVPTSWTRAQCYTELQAHVSPIAWWKVGCFNTSGPTSGDWGNTNGGLPANNSCGWDVPIVTPPPSGCSPLAVFKGICTP